MNKNKSSALILFIVFIAVLFFIGIYIYRSNQPTRGGIRAVPLNSAGSDSNSDTTTTEPHNALFDYTGWETVKGDGFEFMHPGNFIKEENDYYIMAPEPLQGNGEFSGVAIHQPFESDDMIGYLQDKIDSAQEGVGVNVTKEPQKISVDGFKSVYMMEYELQSGYNTGANKFYAFQSPYTNKWVTIEYADNENAENIMRSVKFVE